MTIRSGFSSFAIDIPCSLLVASEATKPRAWMALERPCAKDSSESMRRILLDTKGPGEGGANAKAYGRETRSVNETYGFPKGVRGRVAPENARGLARAQLTWRLRCSRHDQVMKCALPRLGRPHQREHVLLVEVGDQRVDDLIVAPRGDVEPARLRQPHLAVSDAPGRALQLLLRVVDDEQRDAPPVALRNGVGHHRRLPRVDAGEPHALHLSELRQGHAEVDLAGKP